MDDANRIALLTEALERIANPLAAMQRDAEEQGYRLNGTMALALADDANHLKQIARDTLTTIRREYPTS